MTLLAHGIGGAADLPIPFAYAVVGAAWALTFSFAILAFAWREPRLDPDSPGIALPSPVRAFCDSPAVRTILAALGVSVMASALAIGLFGDREPARNALPGMVYIYLWVGVMVASLIVGPVWKIVSPVRAVHRLGCRVAGRDPADGLLPYPASWGTRPAALGLLSFVWLESASPEPGSVIAVTLWLFGYVVVDLAGLVVFGTVWAERGDPLEVYSSLMARLSPLARRGSGTLVLRAPLNNLAGAPVVAGMVAVTATLLGSTAFDSLSASAGWRDLVLDLGGTSVPVRTLIHTAGLLAVIGIVAGVFTLAARATGGVSRSERRLLPIRLAHSLIPVIAGYVVAHYLSFLVEKGQATLLLLADPFGLGWSLPGLSSLDVQYVLSTHPAALGSIKVAAVLTGHILGVAAAHDRCLELLPTRHRLTGQLALMLTMVGFTFTGLYLLF
ncbi:hypothetical protein IU449_05095 [Nocardia higoensis]|uniref:Fenitrothion hydrolase n=1 Tax=Nocardia higoensis TaxID=228599 RepID=A0ABS0D631_9NOCA|nr:hypothetical protein [Nocardia higoensis]MBF6353931.1 hypothetical protein [Nocardia higoensis]